MTTRAGVIAVAVAALLAACGGRSSAARPRAPSDACVRSQVRLDLLRSFAGLGTIGGVFVFENVSRRTCRLHGWPAVTAVTGTGKEVTAKRVRSTMFGPPATLHTTPSVKLPPGGKAGFVLAGGDNPVGASRCPPSYRRLRVAPPGSSTRVEISAWLPGAATYLPSCVPVQVSMIVPIRDLHPS